MSLQSLLDISERGGHLKQGLSEERLSEQLPHLRNLVSFYREYPDYLIDAMLKNNEYKAGEDNPYNPNNFHFYFYQRIFLRVVMRHRYVYATFPRAYSKSFLSMLVLMLRCILYPNSQLFVTTGGKLIFI